jgi:diguanylate cyclase (GGDEF)-like protein/PAS domain S-box-containing protein
MLSLLAVTNTLQARDQFTLSVGVYQNPPKLLLNNEGDISGILGDILVEIALREGWSLKPVVCKWQQCLTMLEDSQIDLLPGVEHNDAVTAKLELHHVPALRSWSQIYQRDGDALEVIPDLEGKRVAVIARSAQELYLQDITDDFGVSVELLPVDSYADGFALLANGEADAVVSNRHYGDQQILSMRVQSTPMLFQPAQLFFASFNGRYKVELEVIDDYLSQWQADPYSPYQAILSKWNEENKSPLKIPAYVTVLISLLAVMLVLTLVFNYLLRLRVTSRTKELVSSEHRLSTILNSVEAHIYIKDTSLRYRYANQALCDLLGKTAAQVVGKSDEELLECATAAKRQKSDRHVIEQGLKTSSEDINALDANGTLRIYGSVKAPLRDANDVIYGLCGIDTDITEFRNIQSAIDQLESYDPLTGLPNRLLMLERLLHALANQARTGFEGALLFIDLDNFKNLNDTLGHEKGDDLLVMIAARLKEHMGALNTLARPGGDEFVIILEGLHQNLEKAAYMAKLDAQNILQYISKPYFIDHENHIVSASIGIVMFTDSPNNTEELLKRAELAMYDAKHSGRNNLRFFNPIMQAEASKRARIESGLRQAVELNQLQLYVQPQVDQVGRVLGMEALLRWTHPKDGAISPSVFIPIAESSGLIIRLGEWVLREACKLLDTWSQQTDMAHLTLAVNISPIQFHHPDFVTMLNTLLEQSRFNPEKLELELTEGLLIENIELTVDRMRDLGAYGIRFSLDDFGTGYASLSYLKLLPFFQLKIDQSFVRDLLTNADDVAIITTIVALGNSLDLRVIAEGVETKEQQTRLLQLGCLYYQGYYFGRPGPAANLGAPA